jgi:hypothetical protein
MPGTALGTYSRHGMTISLNCSCGVLLEVDETFAGQTISCPDCQRPVQVPAPGQGPVHTSGLAIASLVLALVGAFTILGTLLAAVLGGLALLRLKREPGRMTGRGFAIAGVTLGLVLTGLSLFAFSSVELFGLDTLLHEPQWAGRLDYDGPLEVVQSSDGFRITRPSKDWGVLKVQHGADLGFGEPPPQGVLLVNPRRSAYVAVVPVEVPDTWTLEECRDKAKEEFARLDLASSEGPTHRSRWPSQVDVISSKTLADQDETETAELVVVKRARFQDTKYILHVVHKKQDTMMYLVAGGARTTRFAQVEPELREALKSFNLMDRGRPQDWQMNK